MTHFSSVAHLYMGCVVQNENGQWNLSPMDLIEAEKGAVKFTPVLRPLSSLTPAECEVIGYPFPFSAKLNHADHYWNVEDFTFLLNQGVDLFGLIESGQAVDKTKL